MITDENNTFLNWEDFFHKRLTRNGRFILDKTYSKGDTDMEIYTSQKGDLQTTIEVGYLSDVNLMYLNILNPNTPGHNRQQLMEYFYRYQFSPDKSYGGPGLEFNRENITALSARLSQGLQGKEILYYKNGTLIKSELRIIYGDYDQYPSNYRYRFKDSPFPIRVLRKLLGIKEKYEVKEVDLNQVFEGI
jgi:hypothetical protein